MKLSEKRLRASGGKISKRLRPVKMSDLERTMRKPTAPGTIRFEDKETRRARKYKLDPLKELQSETQTDSYDDEFDLSFEVDNDYTAELDWIDFEIELERKKDDPVDWDDYYANEYDDEVYHGYYSRAEDEEDEVDTDGTIEGNSESKKSNS